MNQKTSKLFRKYAKQNAKPGEEKQAYKVLKKEYKEYLNDRR